MSSFATGVSAVVTASTANSASNTGTIGVRLIVWKGAAVVTNLVKRLAMLATPRLWRR
jgi:hypothetical protein